MTPVQIVGCIAVLWQAVLWLPAAGAAADCQSEDCQASENAALLQQRRPAAPELAAVATNDTLVATAGGDRFISQCEKWDGGLGDNPKFTDAKSMDPKWQKYFKIVYGEVPSTRYPICVGSFWYLDKFALSKSGLSNGLKECPKKNGDWFKSMNKYQPPWSAWIRHPPPYGINGKGLPGHTWVEITHMHDGEKQGMFFMFSMGSGVWFNTGKTIVYKEHWKAMSDFCGKCDGGSNGHKDVVMSTAAAKQGYDSIQFTEHKDDQWRCRQSRRYNGAMGIEIVGVKLRQRGSACGDALKYFRAGWNAEKPCECDRKNEWTNCKGFGGGGQ